LNVVFNIVVLSVHALYLGDELSLLGEELGSFLEVLEVLVAELLLFVDDPVYLLVESKELLLVDKVLSFFLVEGLLEVIPVLLFLLLHFLAGIVDRVLLAPLGALVLLFRMRDGRLVLVLDLVNGGHLVCGGNTLVKVWPNVLSHGTLA
jgi:hypothetical protein